MKVEITSPNPQVEKAVLAQLVRVLEDAPKGQSIAELREAGVSFEMPQGPAYIDGKWYC
tara:strand:+ start:71 stop:247 length:177 start_codon:yes stop_codon:yes gene_type:complete